MYKQVKIPNLDPVIYVNGKVLQGWSGWCLAYVKTAFGAPWAGATAWDAWTTTTKLKHSGTPPSGVYVPIWFSHTGTYNGITKNWGHVAIYKDGQVWSSPISNKPTFDKWGSIATVEAKYRSQYVGWSEDVAGMKVIESIEGDEMIATRDEAEKLYKMLRPNAGPSEGEIQDTVGRRSYKNFLNDAQGEISGRDAALRSQAQTINELRTALANEQAKPPKEVVKEVEKIVTQYVDREVVREVEVEPTWLIKVREFINKFLKKG